MLHEGNGHDTELPTHRNLPERISDAYLAISGGNWAKRVRIAHLRDKLKDIPRSDLDETLIGMQRKGKLALYTLD